MSKTRYLTGVVSMTSCHEQDAVLSHRGCEDDVGVLELEPLVLVRVPGQLKTAQTQRAESRRPVIVALAAQRLDRRH